jgi:hypothetical protein
MKQSDQSDYLIKEIKELLKDADSKRHERFQTYRDMFIKDNGNSPLTESLLNKDRNIQR